MAALRQLLNARGAYQVGGPQVPDKTDQDRARSNKTADQTNKLLQSRYNNEQDGSAWQHSGSQDSFGRSNSMDDYNPSRPHHLLRTQTDSTINASHRTDENGFSMDVSSIYEENESPALSPALNKHLALRPLNTQTSNPQMGDDGSKPPKQRRRSRSTTEEPSNGYYGSDPWESYRKDPSSKPTRKESLQLPSKPAEESNPMQHLRDRQRSPQPLHKGKYDPTSPDSAPVKVAHNTFSSTSSPTDSAGNSINENQGVSDNHHHRGNKRKRSLDYSTGELHNMDYVQDLQNESFDAFPTLSTLSATHNLPNPSLPLGDRLRDIYNTATPSTHNTAPTHPSSDKKARALAFFASLSIDQYEESGDLILDGFRDVMDRLRQARREKRKAAKGMEELVAKREEWVRRKRGILETEMGRLRGAGVAVVKPTQQKSGKGSR